MSTPRSTARHQLLSLGLVTLAISLLFVGMIRDFLMALFLAAIFSAMAAPVYRRVHKILGERKGLAAAGTVVLLIAAVLVPLLGVVYLAAMQAQGLAAELLSFTRTIDLDNTRVDLPTWIPFREELIGASAQIASKAGELIGKSAGFFVSAVSALTRGTASFFLSFFVMVYAIFFFLQAPRNVLAALLEYSGLPQETQKTLIERTILISSATIKGTLIIGIVQGFLGGLGFYVSGIDGAAFWGVVIALTSVIPGIGPALILVPGAIYLFVIGSVSWAIALLAWTFLVVTTIDNVLRPMLVGQDTKMPDLLVLVSTLGGLAMFGAVGVIIGPVIGGLFITTWDILRDAWLSDGGSAVSEPSSASPDASQEG